MEHSVYSYLQRQSTQKLEMLLENYAQANSWESEMYTALIREILNQRRKNGCAET
jgi:hypothetical protein